MAAKYKNIEITKNIEIKCQSVNEEIKRYAKINSHAT